MPGSGRRQAELAGQDEELKVSFDSLKLAIALAVFLVYVVMAGDELRAPLAITVIGGLTAATLLTLLVIPCIYVIFSGRRRAMQ